MFRGFRLPASHVIHTVGPIYDVDKNPEASLRNAYRYFFEPSASPILTSPTFDFVIISSFLSGNCYRNSLRVAKENNIQYIAFPAISCGVYGYVVTPCLIIF